MIRNETLTTRCNTLIELKEKLEFELDNYTVRDTYTRGKNCGIQTALVIVDDMIAEGEKEAIDIP